MSIISPSLSLSSGTSLTYGHRESIATIVAELRWFAEDCKFSQMLEEMLQDSLVCGITDSCVEHRLLAKQYLTLKRALKLAQVQEMAEKGMQQLQHQCPQTSSLLKIGHAKPLFHHQPTACPKQRQRDPCYWCGGTHLTAT